MNVFISHALADKDVAAKLAAELKAKGFMVTNPADEGTFVPGENVALKMGKALERADVLVALLSPDTGRSAWVQSEISYALASPKFEDRLVPVMLKRTPDIPWILHNLQVIQAPLSIAELGAKIAERIGRRTTRRKESRTRAVRLARPAFSRA